MKYTRCVHVECGRASITHLSGNQHIVPGSGVGNRRQRIHFSPWGQFEKSQCYIEIHQLQFVDVSNNCSSNTGSQRERISLPSQLHSSLCGDLDHCRHGNGRISNIISKFIKWKYSIFQLLISVTKCFVLCAVDCTVTRGIILLIVLI